MTNYNERLDEILDRVLSQETSREGGYAEYYADDTEYRESLPYGNPLANQGELKQAILDWHNKQVEEAMAKFHLKKGVKYDVKASDSVIVITHTNKLKERADDQL